MKKCIVYIGDFDFRNENVQAHLVKNNGKIFNLLGYQTAYIGVNRDKISFEELVELPPVILPDGGIYYELPNTLNLSGTLKCPGVCRRIIQMLNNLKKEYCIESIISYQSPTYAIAIKRVAKWCRKNAVNYVVNCADLPIFDLQSTLRKIVMKRNWNYLHRVNHRYADGIIAVSRYIDEFYKKEGRPSIVVPPLFDEKQSSFDGALNDIPTFLYAGIPFVVTGHEAAPEGMKDRLDLIVDRFLALSAESVSYRFQIVGISKEDYLASVPRQREALMRENQIEFLGRKTHAETLFLIRQADFSINFRDENLMTKAGFSTKIVESISSGTPVVINDISDTFLYLKDGQDAFMLRGSAAEDHEILKMLCALSAEERLARKKTLFSKKLFDLSNYTDVFASFFARLGRCERK